MTIRIINLDRPSLNRKITVTDGNTVETVPVTEKEEHDFWSESTFEAFGKRFILHSELYLDPIHGTCSRTNIKEE